MLTYSETQYEYVMQVRNFGLRYPAAESLLAHSVSWGLILCKIVLVTVGSCGQEPLETAEIGGHIGQLSGEAEEVVVMQIVL